MIILYPQMKKGNIIIFSIIKKKLLQKYNFYKKKYKNVKKKFKYNIKRWYNLYF